MNMTVTTPAILFPALSLLMLAYTNRYLTLANRVRSLHDQFLENKECKLRDQIESLRHRVNLIKHMQSFGVFSLFMCTVSMFTLFFGLQTLGEIIFGLSLFMMMISLFLSFWEVRISVNALNMHLSDLSETECSECALEATVDAEEDCGCSLSTK